MIIANLKGGIGNQLFQIAAGYALAKRTNSEFKINYNLQHNCIQGFNPKKYKQTLYRDIPETDYIPRNVYSEPHFHYKEIPACDDVIIDGYFQSLKYFDDCIEDIINLFKFPITCIEKHQQIKSKLTEKTIGVHVRRGDYKKYSTIHYLQPCEYYEAAIDMLGGDSLLVATDDWNSFYEEKLLHKYEDTYKIFSTSGCTELDDLFLLSQCSKIVISNSTLAWWAAFLGKRNKQVISPAKWFGYEGPQDFQDIYCNDWTKI
jgi:hypothetical protein